MSKLVSFYSNIKSVIETEPKDIDEILGGIKSGFYKDIVERVRAEKDKAKRDELKKKAPNFTASGLFTKRTDEGLKQHSGFIAIDIDDVEELETTFKLLCNDDYTYACFKSIGGYGLCVLIQIDGKQHRDSFESLKAYFYNPAASYPVPVLLAMIQICFITLLSHGVLRPAAQQPRNMKQLAHLFIFILQASLRSYLALLTQT
jgi:hypothetical protein